MDRAHLGGVFADVRLLVVGIVIAMTPYQPDFALRRGAAVCLLVLATALLDVQVRRADVLAVLYARSNLGSARRPESRDVVS